MWFYFVHFVNIMYFSVFNTFKLLHGFHVLYFFFWFYIHGFAWFLFLWFCFAWLVLYSWSWMVGFIFMVLHGFYFYGFVLHGWFYIHGLEWLVLYSWFCMVFIFSVLSLTRATGLRFGRILYRRKGNLKLHSHTGKSIPKKIKKKKLNIGVQVTSFTFFGQHRRILRSGLELLNYLLKKSEIFICDPQLTYLK